jgi:hypothetical protein
MHQNQHIFFSTPHEYVISIISCLVVVQFSRYYSTIKPTASHHIPTKIQLNFLYPLLTVFKPQVVRQKKRSLKPWGAIEKHPTASGKTRKPPDGLGEDMKAQILIIL